MKAAIVVPCRQARDITPATERCLAVFESLGIQVRRMPHPWLLEDLRSVLVSRFLDSGFDALLQWDADMVTDAPELVPELLFRDEHQGQVRAGLFLRAGGQDGLAAEGLPSPIPERPFVAQLIGGGCLMITREAALKVSGSLPKFEAPDGTTYREFFGRLRGASPADNRYRRLSEIYSFCVRCHQASVPVIADPRINLGHVRRDSNVIDWVRPPAATPRPDPRRSATGPCTAA
ncbi:MAG: hypothetical protein R3337_00075 [Gammaproteobacteria bacterium]|nr:hypothetical protein [Gammaproteobacteria bacterium]